MDSASADDVNHIFLGPQEGDPAAMLISLLHELIHAADDCQSGHKGAFAEAATRLGFEGPMTVKQFGFGQSCPTYELTTPNMKYAMIFARLASTIMPRTSGAFGIRLWRGRPFSVTTQLPNSQLACSHPLAKPHRPFTR